MLKPFLHEHGTSEPVRDGLLPVHHLVLHHLPATLRASTLTMTELAMRPSPDVIIILTAPAALLASRASGPLQRPHIAFAPLAAVAHSPTPPVEETTMKPARKAISTLRGEGTWGTTGGREQVGGQGPGRLQTILPWSSGAPDLACKMRPRHAARVQRPHGQIPKAIRPDTDGHTAENPRTRTRTSRTRTRTQSQTGVRAIARQPPASSAFT